MANFAISAGPLLRHGPVRTLTIAALDEAEARRLAKDQVPLGWHIWRAREILDLSHDSGPEPPPTGTAHQLGLESLIQHRNLR